MFWPPDHQWAVDCLGEREITERSAPPVSRLQPFGNRLVGQAGQLSSVHRCAPFQKATPLEFGSQSPGCLHKQENA